MEKQSYYDWLVASDIADWCKGLVAQAGWAWRESDGKLYAQLKPGITETPWRHQKSDFRLKCGLWHQIMFDLVGAKMPDGKRFVPSKCQNCYKVVARPQTLTQLFGLVEVQKKLDRPSKAGIERRESVFGLYGGYFYNWGLEEGKDCYKLVRKEVDEHKHLGPDVPVFLKRGCTEYEHACGDSDKWEITEAQLRVEQLIERWVVVDDVELKQPEKMVHNTERKWIEFAYANGDETYTQFTDGKPLYPPYQTYHHLIE